MSVKIRLARGGAKKKPFYRFVAATSTSPRDGDFLERLGTYNPMVSKDDPLRLSINKERVSFWLSKGAQPSKIVYKLCSQQNIEFPSSIVKKFEMLKTRYTKKPSKKELKENSQ